MNSNNWALNLTSVMILINCFNLFYSEKESYSTLLYRRKALSETNVIERTWWNDNFSLSATVCTSSSLTLNWGFSMILPDFSGSVLGLKEKDI